MEEKKNSDLAEKLLQLEMSCFPEDFWTKEMILSHLQHGYVSLLDDLAYIFYLENADEMEILRIGVVPEKRGRGIAASLISTLAKKGKNIILEVRESNIPARKLYKKCGFTEIGKRKNYYNNGETAVIYRLSQQAQSP